jgi:hypothetical protein
MPRLTAEQIDAAKICDLIERNPGTYIADRHGCATVSHKGLENLVGAYRQLRAERDEAALNNKKLRADLAGTHEAFTQQVKLKRVAIRGRAKSESERDTAIERAEKAEGEQDKLLALLSLDQKNEGWPRMVAELRARVAELEGAARKVLDECDLPRSEYASTEWHALQGLRAALDGEGE